MEAGTIMVHGNRSIKKWTLTSRVCETERKREGKELADKE